MGIDVQVAPAPTDTRSAAPTGGVVTGLLAAMRPKQWVKQILLVIAPVAAGVLDSGRTWFLLAVGIVTFTMAAAGNYLVNDASDVAADRAHPTKRFRPLASGRVPLPLGWAAAAVLLPASIALGAAFSGWRLATVLAVYIVMTLAYSRYLKHVAIVELMIVALGFVLRALAGAAAVRVPLSEWFVIVASFGSLFMVVGKRYAEATTLSEGGVASRRILAEYPLAWLRQVRDVSISVTLLAYCLFAFERGASATHGGPFYQLSIAPVTLGLLRYALLLEKGQGGAPEEVVLHDRTLMVAGILWAVLFGLGVAHA